MSLRLLRNMKYFLTLLVFSLELLIQSGLSDQLVDDKIFTLYKKTNYQENNVFDEQFQKKSECKCRNGECVNEGGREVCKCAPGNGNYTSTLCIDCNCGPDINCMWESGIFGLKICFCKPGFIDKKGQCVDCNCGPGGLGCKWVNQMQQLRKKVCVCKPGYSEQDGICIDLCFSNPCKNDGKCTVEGKSFKCECLPPFGGKTCETGPCASNPCQNNGICTVEKQSFKCECLFPFGGKTCETGPCTSNPCQNNGICSVEKQSFKCECLPPFGGKICETECYCGENSKSCNFNSEGKKECSCFPGYAEKNGLCDECNCGSYGSCRIEYGEKQCHCFPFAVENNGVCVVMETTSSEDKTFEVSTVLTSTTQGCHCGSNSYGCLYLEGNKVCNCFVGYSELHGLCTECNCGPYGECSFLFDRKKCHCRPFAIEINGVCVDRGTTSSEITATSTVQDRGTSSSEIATEPTVKNRLTTLSEIQTESVSLSTDQDCNCGENSKSCRFNWRGDKICNCLYGYAENYGYCEKCNCGPFGSCNFRYGQKHCDCLSFAIEKNGVCVVIETTSPEYRTIEISTILPSTVYDCHCGFYSYSCTFDKANNKVCDCLFGYSQLGDVCAECNCGPYGTCSFEYGRKKCNCFSFTIEINGVCVDIGTFSPEETTTESVSMSTTLSSTFEVTETADSEDTTFVTSTIVPSTTQAICSEDKCVHGKCEIIGKDFICRCNIGYTGKRCEEKIGDKEERDLWKIIQVSVLLAIFIMLSGVLCLMTRILSKRS